MDKVLVALPILALVVLLGVLAALAWRRRAARQSAVVLPVPPAEIDATPLDARVLYAGTTRAGAPLERVTAGGLGFRADAAVTVARSGVLLALAGGTRVWIPRERIRGAGTAAWTLDKGAGRDRLVVLRWELDGLGADGSPAEVETHLATPARAALLAALAPLNPTQPRSADQEVA